MDTLRGLVGMGRSSASGGGATEEGASDGRMRDTIPLVARHSAPIASTTTLDHGVDLNRPPSFMESQDGLVGEVVQHADSSHPPEIRLSRSW